MAQLWHHWGVRDLQALIGQREPELLQRLERIIPAVVRDFNANELYLRDNLIRVLESFIASDAFSQKDFRLACLDRLPPDELRALGTAVGLESKGREFRELRDEIASKSWTGRFAQLFVAHFSLPDHFLPSPKAEQPSTIRIAAPSSEKPFPITAPFKQLKGFQFGVFERASSQLSAAMARFIIQMPTGSGKTRTAMEIVCGALNEKPRSVVIWLAHAEELCEQAIECFLEVWPYLARHDLDVHRAWGKHEIPILEIDKPAFVVAGFDKLHSALKRNESALAGLARRATLVVVDEAHKTEAPTYKRVVKELLSNETAVIGLTATPGRAGGAETDHLATFYFNTRVDIPAPPDVGVIGMLRDHGILAHAEYTPLTTDITVKLTPAQQRRIADQFDIPKAVLERLGADDLRNVEIGKRLAELCEAGKRVLLFACSVAHSRFLTSLLLFQGYSAGHLDGFTAPARRRALISSFRQGRTQVLCNFGVLTTGFDAPRTDVVFVARPTASAVLYSQMIGRGLRGPAIGGTESCTIVDVRDNIVGFGDADSVYELFDEYWTE